MRRTGGVAAVALYLLLAVLYFAGEAIAVKSYLFRKCDQNPFCKRNRHYADQVSAADLSWRSPYEIDIDSVSGLTDGSLTANILKTTATGNKVELPLTVTFLESGSVRVTVDEEVRASGKNEIYGSSKLQKRRYNTLEEWVLAGHLKTAADRDLQITKSEESISVDYGTGNKVVFTAAPFAVKFYRNNELQVVLNDRGFMNYEHWRPKPEGDGAKDPQIGAFELDDGLWEDSFDSKTDKKSKGPEAVALDISFVNYKNVYGIPEHADKLSLRETRGGEGNHNEPYRLFNVDIFEYETNSPMSMYGAIPFMQAHKVGGSAGVFWLNAADTYIDIVKTKPQDDKVFNLAQTTQTHWISEAGLLDVFVFLGDSPAEINKMYGEVTGFTQLPQSFAIGHHQCRWNYNSQEDVLEVNENFSKHNIPYDVIWLDIEYTDAKKYFTWNKDNFPNPEEMLDELDESKRKLVAIIDPHIKVTNDYDVVNHLEKNDLAIEGADGKPFYGHCWPGESLWVDTFAPKAREYWNKLFALGTALGGAAKNLHIWNDMNEPSVFSGPETTAPKDDIHFGGWEHREVHNVYGQTFFNATVEAMNLRYKNEQRPFVLTRSYFAGSQRTGAMWTGDNMAKWEYLKIATPMILTQGVVGMPFSGADVGGFFENPSNELLTRWYQAGAFYPFFRAHAHIDSKRREPWIAGGIYTPIMADAIKLRYKLLPTFYTAFHESSVNGAPVLKPVYYVSPDNEASFGIDDQFFVGDSGLLVKPITDEGATSTEIYIPDDEVYYDYKNEGKVFKGIGNHQYTAPLDTIPIIGRGGHIFARRDRERRSATLMKYDPFTLVVHVGKDGSAEGSLYVDDGESYKYEEGEFINVKFSFDKSTGKFTANNVDGSSSKYLDTLWVEKVIFTGFSSSKATATVTSAANKQTVNVEKSGYSVTVKGKLPLAKGFEISF